MSRDEFIMLVRDPGLVDRRFTGEVSELIGIYPYFQSAHLLFLKGLRNSSDIKFRNQLAYPPFMFPTGKYCIICSRILQKVCLCSQNGHLRNQDRGAPLRKLLYQRRYHGR